jgi:hypothetical protein
MMASYPDNWKELLRLRPKILRTQGKVKPSQIQLRRCLEKGADQLRQVCPRKLSHCRGAPMRAPHAPVPYFCAPLPSKQAQQSASTASRSTVPDVPVPL